jgi:hypothetical protein
MVAGSSSAAVRAPAKTSGPTMMLLRRSNARLKVPTERAEHPTDLASLGLSVRATVMATKAASAIAVKSVKVAQRSPTYQL